MDAIILAGGMGTRLRSVVSDCPKPLAPIADIPFLDYLLQQLSGKISRAILAVGYKGDPIIERYSELDFGFPILFSEEDSPLGTGGAACKAASLAKSDTIWVLNGDSYFAISFGEMEKAHRGDVTIACRKVEDVSRYGSLKLEQERIVAFEEKGGVKAGWINGGIYLLKKELLLEEKRAAFSLEHDFFPQLLLSHKELFAYRSAANFIDIGTPASYQRAEEVIV